MAQKTEAPRVEFDLAERSRILTDVRETGLTDSKGRALGYCVIIERQILKPTPEGKLGSYRFLAPEFEGESFVVIPQTLRAGVQFGSSQSGSRVKTIEAAQARAAKAMEAGLNGQRKRAAK